MSVNGKQLMSDSKFYESYSRYKSEESRYETWEESVTRVFEMHKIKYAEHIKNNLELKNLIEETENAYKNKLFLGAQRALQFGGDQLLSHNSRLYNCASSYADRSDFFGGLMYLLLSGCGVGFSVQFQHIAKIPKIAERTNEAVTFKVPDSIEGWQEAIDVLMSSYFIENSVYNSYQGKKVHFDLSDIRPKGSFISGGFKAPGSEPLRKALDNIELLIESEIKEGAISLRSIVVYDICMYIADAVISGGVRRAATICVFSKEDRDMMNAKTGNWFISNPQRGRSNNSVALLKDKTTLEEFIEIMNFSKESGDPGVLWLENLEFMYNPCVEVGMLPYTKDGRSGFQLCNLTEINGLLSKNKNIFFEQCKYASILGTLQAGYTDFKHLKDATKEVVEKEALIGVGITGIMNNPKVLCDPKIQQEGAEIVKKWNKIISDIIEINQAARCCVIKPSGNSSVILGSSSGIHAWHSKRCLRHVQFNKETEIAQVLQSKNPNMCEDSVWNKERDIAVAFPIVVSNETILKKDQSSIEQIDNVILFQQNWIEYGTNIDLCTNPNIRHNVSNTITVDDWDSTIYYIYKNRNNLCGVSLLSENGDRAYPQAPFTEVLTEQEIIDLYGDKSMFTSALIEYALDSFNGDLWNACNTAMDIGEVLTDSHSDFKKKEFVRRFKKFAKNFKTKQECANCLKDIYNLHKFWKINKTIKNIDWQTELKRKNYVEIDTLAGANCSGGVCEIQF